MEVFLFLCEFWGNELPPSRASWLTWHLAKVFCWDEFYIYIYNIYMFSTKSFQVVTFERAKHFPFVLWKVVGGSLVGARCFICLALLALW